MPSRPLEKWHAYHIWCSDYRPPHHQKCVCVCPVRKWFLFINSDPPQGRKARQFALEISSYEAQFLKHVSFPKQFDEDPVDQSLLDEKSCFGHIGPSLVARLSDMIRHNPTLTDAQKAIILE